MAYEQGFAVHGFARSNVTAWSIGLERERRVAAHESQLVSILQSREGRDDPSHNISKGGGSEGLGFVVIASHRVIFRNTDVPTGVLLPDGRATVEH